MRTLQRGLVCILPEATRVVIDREELDLDQFYMAWQPGSLGEPGGIVSALG